MNLALVVTFVVNLTSINVLCFGVDNALIEKRSIFLGWEEATDVRKMCIPASSFNLALAVAVDKYLTQNRLETWIPKMGLRFALRRPEAEIIDILYFGQLLRLSLVAGVRF